MFLSRSLKSISMSSREDNCFVFLFSLEKRTPGHFVDNSPQYVTVCGSGWAERGGVVSAAPPPAPADRKPSHSAPGAGVWSGPTWAADRTPAACSLAVRLRNGTWPGQQLGSCARPPRPHGSPASRADTGQPCHGACGAASPGGTGQLLGLHVSCLGASPCGPRCCRRAPQCFTATDCYSCRKNELDQ